MTTDDDLIDDDQLLIEAARYAVKSGVQRNRFMTQAKRAWFQADAEERGRRWGMDSAKSSNQRS